MFACHGDVVVMVEGGGADSMLEGCRLGACMWADTTTSLVSCSISSIAFCEGPMYTQSKPCHAEPEIFGLLLGSSLQDNQSG